MKKLLITMGDSWTEGIGCYTAESLRTSKDDMNALYNENTQHRQLYSWPAQLARAKDWHLKNLGLGGASNSGQVKLLYQLADEIAQGHESVQVIFMLTDPYRFSFYTQVGHGKCHIKQYHPVALSRQDIRLRALQAKKYTPDDLTFMEYYVRTQTDAGMVKETEFYIQCAAMLCRAKAWDFKWLSSFSTYDYSDHNCLHTGLGVSCAIQLVGKNLAHCNHPNEQGYARIAQALEQCV
jgi:hypothetical protein